MRVVISKTICDLVGQGMTAQQAAQAGVHILAEHVNGLGGAIVLDHEGRLGFAFNTPRMAHAYVLDGKIIAKI
jgi:beta-aspartyl-peptidase (threonine type)